MLKIYVELDEKELQKKIELIIASKVDEVIEDKLLWTVKNLAHQLSIGETKLRETVLLDPRLPKFKIGANWRFPVKQTKEFIEIWALEQIEQQRNERHFKRE